MIFLISQRSILFLSREIPSFSTTIQYKERTLPSLYSYIRAYFQLVAFVREHIWNKALLMGYLMRLELTRVCSLNDFQLVMGFCSPMVRETGVQSQVESYQRLKNGT